MIFVLEDQGARDYQEDRHDIQFNLYKNLHMMAIWDGHGGSHVSSLAKIYFKKILANELQSNNNIENALSNSFKRFQNILPEELAEQTGSTALIILKDNNTLYIANLGDCRAIINSNNRAIQITTDHKPNNEIEYNRITALGGIVINRPNDVARVNGNLAVSRSFGDLYLKPYISHEPDIFKINLNSTNKFLLAASDGLWDVLDNDEIVQFINSKLDRDLLKKNPKKLLNDITLELLQKAREAYSGDNITIILIIL